MFTVMTTSTPEKQDGLKILQEAITEIKVKITEYGGVFNVQMGVSFLTINFFHSHIENIAILVSTIISTCFVRSVSKIICS